MNTELIAESRSHADSLRVVMQDQAAETIESLCSALETLQAEVKHLNLHPKATQSGRDAALARLAITEEANSMLLARNKWLEHTLEVAGASPAQPSQALELSQQEAEALAHRRASKYAHRSDSSYVAYTFLPHTLMDFVRDVTAVINAKEKQWLKEK